MVDRPLSNTNPSTDIEAPVRVEEEAAFVASQWKLIWWRFRKHRMAVVSTILLILLYAVALFSEFIAPYDPNTYVEQYVYTPPQQIHFVDEAGNFQIRPFVYGLQSVRDPVTRRMVYDEDTTIKYPLYLLVEGTP